MTNPNEDTRIMPALQLDSLIEADEPLVRLHGAPLAIEETITSWICEGIGWLWSRIRPGGKEGRFRAGRAREGKPAPVY